MKVVLTAPRDCGLHNLKEWTVKSQIILARDFIEGEEVEYIPLGISVNKEFLRENSLYKDKTLNKNPDKSGFFHHDGVVRSLMIEGIESNGFIWRGDVPHGNKVAIKKKLNPDHISKTVHTFPYYTYEKATGTRGWISYGIMWNSHSDGDIWKECSKRYSYALRPTFTIHFKAMGTFNGKKIPGSKNCNPLEFVVTDIYSEYADVLIKLTESEMLSYCKQYDLPSQKVIRITGYLPKRRNKNIIIKANNGTRIF